jgi:hypothetical protein
MPMTSMRSKIRRCYKDGLIIGVEGTVHRYRGKRGEYSFLFRCLVRKGKAKHAFNPYLGIKSFVSISCPPPCLHNLMLTIQLK